MRLSTIKLAGFKSFVDPTVLHLPTNLTGICGPNGCGKSNGTLGGEYAGFNEISVKRSVSRDAQSDYYLNGVRCRRRDITDLFLGTGLGARSYSIIEQGVISDIVESRPEQLRIH